MTITDTAAESQPFQAEVSQLLHLMVHSVYSETDIFLRELISNASDACDKLRYEAIARPDLIEDGEPPKISIVPSKKDNTLVVADSAIGMDRQELIDNLGTIARSGTKAFVSRPLTEHPNLETFSFSKQATNENPVRMRSRRGPQRRRSFRVTLRKRQVNRTIWLVRNNPGF
jgi:hypothetical protein